MIKDKQNKQKKKIIVFLIVVLTFFVTVATMTYAYFALSASDATTISGTVGGVDLVLTVTRELPTTNPSDMIPQLEKTLDEAVSSDFNCIDGRNNVVCQLYKVSISNVGSISTKVTGSIKFFDIDNLPNLKWKRINSITDFGEYETYSASVDEHIFDSGRELNGGDTYEYYFVIWVDEVGGEQEDDGTFKATINFNAEDDSVSSTSAANYIENLYNTGEPSDYTTVNIGGDSSPQQVTLNTKKRIMMVDQGSTYGVEYRYYGNDTVEDPSTGKYLTKNYVDFNGELWRIISVSKVFSSETDTTGETRVRIIKDTPIGNYAWDNDDYTNNWADSTLMCQLNTMYYNDTVPACTGKSLTSLTTSLNDEARNLIDNALWYLGGGSNSDLYADDYYTMERGTKVADSSYPYRWTGKVGIMYPSDYVYAADLSQCKNTGYNYMDWDSWEPDPNCAETDWLFNRTSQWLMSPNSVSNVARSVYETGCVVNGGVDGEYGVRPLAVLKSDVTITGGEGTSGSPYQLALSE